MDKINKILVPFPEAENDLQTSNKSLKQISRNLPDSVIPAENVALKISQMLDRFYFEQGWNIKRVTQDEKDEHTNRIKFWMQVLASEKIPIGEFDAIYLRCISNRAKAKASGQNVAIKLNPEDFLAAWFQIKKEREQNQQARVRDYQPNCFLGHRDPKTARMQVVNPFNFDEDIILPCAYCRPNEYQEARSNFINTSGEIKPLDILNNVIDGEFGKEN